MFWLLFLVFILQFGFHWVLEPLIVLSTPIFEAHAIWLGVLLVGGWLLSGKGKIDGFGRRKPIT